LNYKLFVFDLQAVDVFVFPVIVGNLVEIIGKKLKNQKKSGNVILLFYSKD